MKAKLFLLLLFISSFTFGQNWSQVGATQFSSNFVRNAEIAFDNAGTPFVVYENISDTGIYVEKYDGTNWVQVGTGTISTENYNNITIKINPVTDQPWVVLKSAAGGASSNLDVYSFDGSTWVSEGQNVGGGLYSYGIQLQFNASGNPRIAGIVSGALPNKGGKFFTKTNTGWSELLGISDREARIDFYGYNEYVMADSDGFIRKLDVASASSQTITVFVSGSTTDYRKISGIKGTDFFATYKINGSSIKVGNNSNTIAEPIGGDAVEQGNGILKFRESSTDNRFYLMFEETDNSIVFQKYKTGLDTWQILPNIGLSTTATDFFVKMEMNSVDGNMYVLYKDGGKMSVKKFNIETPLNLTRIYVDADATGTNDGSSWADAYTDLQDALDNIYTNTTEFWVAEGTYISHVSDRSKSFTIFQDNVTLYGGFDGTETTLADRDLTANHNTILSGDLNGDDTGVTLTNGSGRGENSYHVVKIAANNITLDGLKIENGHARGSASNAYGAAVLISDTVNAVTFKNCEFNKNVGSTGGAIKVYFNTNASFIMENCKFNNNLSRYGSGLYLLVNSNRTVTVDITNTLFSNNKSANINNSSKGYTGSAAWIRANAGNSTVTTTITNCTFTNNSDIGTQPGSERGPLALSKRTDGNSTHNATINNSIFYGNTTTGGAVSISINKGHVLAVNTVAVNNSIGEDSFPNSTTLSNVSSSDPLFTDAANDDFTLQSGSPAIDTGDNSLVPSGITADLLQNDRIFNTTVDMGCYEYGSSPLLAVEDFENELSFIVYPNPVIDILNIKMDTTFEKAEIYNILGEKILMSDKKTIDVSRFQNGVYFVKIANEKGLSVVKRFIKH